MKSEIQMVLSSLDFSPSKDELGYLKKETQEMLSILREAIKKEKINADVFLGGSFAKNTLAGKEKHDVDIYARFEQTYEDLSSYLERIIKRVSKKSKRVIERIHGSRDYFRIKWSNKIYFEIIPVIKIKNPKEARNITDLSYFHVNYIKRKLKNKGLAKGVLFAKSFCKAQGVYGAESYINGFSGYGLECLIVKYKSFEKMLNQLVKVKERLIIDSEKKYKKNEDPLFYINESKLKSPIILIDPTWKERNVLASLSYPSFRKFQDAANAFLKKPDKSFFEAKEIDTAKLKKEARKERAEFVHVKIWTNKQEGDIAGTKLKKFANFLEREISFYFKVLKKEFVYDEKKCADLYLIAKSKKEIIKIGPPVIMKKNAGHFKEKNKNVFEKNGYLHSRMKVNFSAKEFIIRFAEKEARKLREMNIKELKALD